MDNLCNWLAVARTSGFGARTAKQLFSFLSDQSFSLFDVLNAPASELATMGFSPAFITKIANVDFHSVEQELDQIQHWLDEGRHRWVYALGDGNYPPQLLELDDAPTVLFGEGDPSVLHAHQIAMVGSRHASKQGLARALEYSSYLSQCGWVVTSGLAQGVDAMAHQGALNLGLPTVGVIGTGIDKHYPLSTYRHRQDIIASGGAVVSELPLGAEPLPRHFPRRNRIVAGLSRGVLVVEAAIKSGSLVTAKQALEQGREVFAMPAAPNNPHGEGCNWLIRQGALLVDQPEQILEELSCFKTPDADIEMQSDSQETDELNESELPVLAALGWEPTPADYIADQLKMSIDEVLQQLLTLELEGKVELVSQGYQRCG